MVAKKIFLFFLFLFFTQFANAQLSNFTLAVTKTDETCNDNGTLTFSVSNTTTGSTLLYSVYLLPNTTTPVSVQSTTTLSGLTAGTYRVVATQSLGGNSGAQQRDITIDNLYINLLYQVASNSEVCGNDGTITISATQGIAVRYEIFSGPMTRPSQTSNTFSGLTAGIYQIRVYDNCNQGVVQTFTLLRADNNLSLSVVSPSLNSCNTINIGFNFQSFLPQPQGTIRYPLQVTTTLLLPSGTQTYTNTVAAGNSFAQTVPHPNGQPYNYSFTVTDACGRVSTLSGVVPDLQVAQINYIAAPQDCTYMLLAFSNVTALTMTSAPATYSGTVPQSFTASILNNRVSVGNLTAGTYVFQAYDMCGILHVLTIVVVL